ncbi:MAG TPA: purine-nucleoside phosphorylase [Bacteroidales bacterium]|jgi:purine-nucleoside phosphorylase|nr:purine-nucleoside phosphorylase [Bacteroidota bacterium]HJN07011.1 purine-nucleoside phosphorylase [Bacteroidales bacterium]|tara:strand:- start:3112 stop:3924 length:813 start_codon:yes stop_codon:yes gene_type:complete
MHQKIQETTNYLVSKGVEKAQIGIILGTGLGNLVNHVDIKVSLDYSEIPNFPEATVESHSGKLIYGTIEGQKVILMSGRYHYYEGYTLQEVTFPVRIMKMLGIHTLLVSNACGAVNPAFPKASLMIIDDHINMIPGNPLIGINHSKLGPRFVDMSMPYDASLITKMEAIAERCDIVINKGVYVAWSGPSLETRAEYRFIKFMGADVVGMSTVPEVIVANHAGLKVAAVSVITDLCDPDNLQAVELSEMLENAAKAEKDLIVLFKELIKEI